MLLLVLAAALEAAPLAVTPGPHAVGFRVLNVQDATRRTPSGTLRPVQVSVWYPARAGAVATPLLYRDYVAVAASETTLAPLHDAGRQAALARYRGFLERNGIPAAGIDEWLAAPMRAQRDAAAEPGAFPLILIAQGMGGAVHDQAALGEHLASHGYVVATTPSPVRLGVPMESDADVLPMAREQARDLEIARERLRSTPQVDGARTGLVGYSFGGRSALLLSGPSRGIQALVSLDGGIGTSAAKGWLPAAAFDRRAVRLPILHVHTEGDPAATPDLTLLRSLRRAERTLARIAGMAHHDFITFGAASAALPSLGASDRDGRAARLRAVFGLTRAFLDTHVKGDVTAWAAAVRTAPAAIVRITPLSR
jgi:dienelactone hydrolase